MRAKQKILMKRINVFTTTWFQPNNSSKDSKLIYSDKYGGPNKNHALNRVVLEHYTTVNVDCEEKEQDIV